VRFVPNQGAAFLDDLVDSVKPFVDANYPTLPDRTHTALIGSSLGGLETDYALHRYPQVFGKAGIFSPSYWVSDEPFRIAADHPLPAGTRVFLYMGGKEGEDSVPLLERMARLLRAQPALADAVAVRVDLASEHNETAWRAVFPDAVRFLFGLDEVPAAATAASR
jgi:predicted alpha/beta superfamily hydrolase